MIDISAFKKLNGTRLEIADTSYIDGKEAKRIRVETFHMGQNAFAEALDVPKKTFEKWESGDNKPMYRIVDEKE